MISAVLSVLGSLGKLGVTLAEIIVLFQKYEPLIADILKDWPAIIALARDLLGMLGYKPSTALSSAIELRMNRRTPTPKEQDILDKLVPSDEMHDFGQLISG